MRQFRHLATLLLVCVGFTVPAGGFAQGRGNRSEHRTSNNNHRTIGNSGPTRNNNRGGDSRIKLDGDRGKVSNKDHGNKNRDHGSFNRDREKVNGNHSSFNRNREKVNKGETGRPGNGSRPVIVNRNQDNRNRDQYVKRNPNRGPVNVNPRPNPRPNPVPGPNPGNHYGKRPIVRPNVGYHPAFVGRHHGGWGRPLPPPPPRPARRYFAGAPLIDFGLGLVYGSLLNTGVGALINAGLNVAATVNDAIYLSNVVRYGVTWPQVTMYYDSGRLSGARYQYGSPYTNYGVYDNVYSQLVGAYGAPVSVDYNGSSRTATWWGGGNSGYVTLSFSPGYDDYGNAIYYTDLLYGQ